MPNTYTQIHIQCVFAVKYRDAMITKQWKEQLHQYTTGIVQNHGHKVIAINSMPVKVESSEWINIQKFTKSKFNWQEGYGAFSYSRSHIDAVVKYILDQEKHHQKRTFLEEYREFLVQFEVDFDERYIFRSPE